MQWDWTFGVFLLGLPLTAIGLVYKEPRLYTTFDKLLMKAMSTVTTGGMAFAAGAFALGKALENYVTPGNLALAKETSQVYFYIGLLISMSGMGCIALSLILKKVADLGTEHRNPPTPR